MADEAKYGVSPLSDRGIVSLPMPLPLPMKIDCHVGAFDEDSIDPDVQLYAIVYRKVPFDLELKPTQAVEGHEHGLECCRIFVDIRLTQAFDGRIDAPDLRSISGVHAVGFRAGECHHAQEADEHPHKEFTNAFSNAGDHAPTIIARSGSHAAPKNLHRGLTSRFPIDYSHPASQVFSKFGHRDRRVHVECRQEA